MSTTTEPQQTAGPRRKMKRSQKRLLIRTLQYLALIGVVVFFALVGNWKAFADSYLNTEVMGQLLPKLITTGLKNTLIYTATSFVFGLLLGLIIALMRLSEVRLYRALATAYVELFRGLPTLLVLFLVNFGVPIVFEVRFNFYILVTIGLGSVAAAYMSETIRAGIQAVPKGQMEAARTLGMSRGRAMISIIIPQALRIVIPPLTNELILLIKDSSLVYALGVMADQYELTKLSTVATNGAIIGIGAGPTPLLMAGLAYLVITLPLSQAVRRLEIKQAARR